MNNKTALKAAFQKNAIEGKIKNLARTCYSLAPHPEHPAQRGPLFVSLQSQFKPAAEYEGMLGNIMLESFIGAAFADAANDNGSGSAAAASASLLKVTDLDTIAESISEYAQYREELKRERGQGSFALGEHKTICNKFNTVQDDAVIAYYRDLEKRLKIEETIASLSRELSAINRSAPQLTLSA